MIKYKVTLRQKPIDKGKKASLFLDITFGGNRYKEYLKLHVFTPAKSTQEKKYNQQIHNKAEIIRLERIKELENSFLLENEDKKYTLFIEYFAEQVLKREGTANGNQWKSALSCLLNIIWLQDLQLEHIDYRTAERIKSFMLNDAKQIKSKEKKLARNTARQYFNKVLVTIKEAFFEGILPSDISARVKAIPEQEVHKDYLTIEDLRKLAETPCHSEVLKRACIFSALTGLRFKNVQLLTFQNVIIEDGVEPYLKYRQIKRDNIEILPINEETLTLIGEFSSDPTKAIFEGLKYSNSMNTRIREWVLRAGIKKSITFHNFRHTYGNLIYQQTGDLYLTNKMMGQKSINNTLRYVKMDRRKAQNTVKNIPNILKNTDHE